MVLRRMSPLLTRYMGEALVDGDLSQDFTAAENFAKHRAGGRGAAFHRRE